VLLSSSSSSCRRRRRRRQCRVVGVVRRKDGCKSSVRSYNIAEAEDSTRIM
jgi:hypothetical protein